MKMQIGLAVAVSMWAGAGRPCDQTALELSTVGVPFEGHELPRNATLQVLREIDTVFGELLGPDNRTRRVTWPDGERAAIDPPLDDDGLAPGRWSLTLRFVDEVQDRSSRSIVFGVADRVDTDAAAIRFSYTRRTGGEPAWTPDNPCGPVVYRWPTTFSTISLDEEDADEDIAWLELDSGERLTLNDGALERVEDLSVNLAEVVVVDFAGNRSEVVPEDADGGCGCNSADSPVVVGALGLLALLRRRRR